jgi:hypothetical protein
MARHRPAEDEARFVRNVFIPHPYGASSADPYLLGR